MCSHGVHGPSSTSFQARQLHRDARAGEDAASDAPWTCSPTVIGPGLTASWQRSGVVVTDAPDDTPCPPAFFSEVREVDGFHVNDISTRRLPEACLRFGCAAEFIMGADDPAPVLASKRGDSFPPVHINDGIGKEGMPGRQVRVQPACKPGENDDVSSRNVATVLQASDTSTSRSTDQQGPLVRPCVHPDPTGFECQGSDDGRAGRCNILHGEQAYHATWKMIALHAAIEYDVRTQDPIV